MQLCSVNVCRQICGTGGAGGGGRQTLSDEIVEFSLQVIFKPSEIKCAIIGVVLEKKLYGIIFSNLDNFFDKEISKSTTEDITFSISITVTICDNSIFTTVFLLL